MPTATQMIPRIVAVSLQPLAFFDDDFAALFTELGGQADIQWGREQAVALHLLQQSPAPSAVLIKTTTLRIPDRIALCRSPTPDFGISSENLPPRPSFRAASGSKDREHSILSKNFGWFTRWLSYTFG